MNGINIKTQITNIGDPFILQHNSKYYMYATSAPNGFKVFTSIDLKNWDNGQMCYTKSDSSFGYKDFWAPEVVARGDKFIMHYTARDTRLDSLRIGVAIADSPDGEFIDVYKNRPMFDLGYACIDAHIFFDGDKNYMFYAKDCSENILENRHESHIYGVEISSDLTSLTGVPKLLSQPTYDYESGSGEWRWNEAPFVYKKSGKYFLMYSANCFDSKLYCVCLAVSDSPLGDYKKIQNNPILKYKQDKVSGPGHNALFTDCEGNTLITYHIHTDYNNPSGNRRAVIAGVDFNKDGIIIVPELLD